MHLNLQFYMESKAGGGERTQFKRLHYLYYLGTYLSMTLSLSANTINLLDQRKLCILVASSGNKAVSSSQDISLCFPKHIPVVLPELQNCCLIHKGCQQNKITFSMPIAKWKSQNIMYDCYAGFLKT